MTLSPTFGHRFRPSIPCPNLMFGGPSPSGSFCHTRLHSHKYPSFVPAWDHQPLQKNKKKNNQIPNDMTQSLSTYKIYLKVWLHQIPLDSKAQPERKPRSGSSRSNLEAEKEL